jgi:hypothetical protein
VRSRRSRSRPSDLTSLLDVLFILLFAALVSASTLVARAREAPLPALPAPPPVAVPATSPAPTGPPPPLPRDQAALRQQAAAAVVAASARTGTVTAAVSAEGRITRLTVRRGAERRDLAVDLPLLERVPDPDVGLAYLGHRIPDMRVCTALRRALGGRDLGGALVIIRPARALADLPVALVDGLREDQRRCYPEENGLAVLLEGPAAPDEDKP